MKDIMGFYSGTTTPSVHGWVSIIWFTSAVIVAGLELHTISELVVQCGQNVTLQCEVTISDKSDIKLFLWLGVNKTCQYEDQQSDPEALCESTDNSPKHKLNLLLPNIMPVDQGRYLCKLRSTQGTESAPTNVTVKECEGHHNYSINKSQAKCWFSGVYPSGIIHWFQEDVNLTDSASTEEVEDQHGLYNISSTIDVQKGKSSKPYNCSLWIPSAMTYLSTIELPITQPQESSGSMVTLQWIFVMVEIMMVTIMT